MYFMAGRKGQKYKVHKKRGPMHMARFANGKAKATKFKTRAQWAEINKEERNNGLYMECLSNVDMEKELKAAAEAKRPAGEYGEGESDEDERQYRAFELQEQEQQRRREMGGGISHTNLHKHASKSSSSSSSSFSASSSVPSASFVDSHLMTFRSDPQRSMDIAGVLRNVFNHQDGFRPGQETAIRRVLAGMSTLLVLPTGAGKSLCYQLPAFLLPGLTLVISPLIALMNEQVLNLPAQLPGAAWNSSMKRDDVLAVMDGLRNAKYKLLFVSPEKLLTPGFQRFMARLPSPGVSFACIDEVHCVSEWSHNFRPGYLRLFHALTQTIGATCILGLTATATQITTGAICRSLRINANEVEHLSTSLSPTASLLPGEASDSFAAHAVTRVSPQRDNLMITCSKDADKQTALVKLLKSKGRSRHTPAMKLCVYVCV
jgi:hypothetical protein